jgi:LytS/YehU family sensor histidine kinase
LEELRAAGEHQGEAEYLGWAVERLAESMGASLIQGAGEELERRLAGCDLIFPTPAADLSELRRELEGGGVEAVVPLRFSPGDVRYVLLGRRVGGRRYLSEDLQALARLAAQIVERVEEVRQSEMRRLVSQAELRALQAQIHPHFLFNALNTLYGVIPKEAAGARRTVVNLADIFRYFLQSDKTYIPLGEELRIVNAYLEIESLRLGPKLRTEIHVDEAALRIPIPILSIQPLVENAVKHGVAAKAEGGLVRLDITLASEGLQVCVEDTGGGFASTRKTGSGVGLENVTRRLRLCFGPEASLQIESTAGGARVRFLAPVQRTEEAVR